MRLQVLINRIHVTSTQTTNAHHVS